MLTISTRSLECFYLAKPKLCPRNTTTPFTCLSQPLAPIVLLWVTMNLTALDISRIIQYLSLCCCCSVDQSCPTLLPHGLQHTRLPCPSPSPGAYSNSCPLSWWCHPTISSSVVPFSSCPQCFSASGSFLMNQLFVSGGQNIGASASASVLPMNIQDWFPLGRSSLISLQSKGLSRVFPSTTVP